MAYAAGAASATTDPAGPFRSRRAGTGDDGMIVRCDLRMVVTPLFLDWWGYGFRSWLKRAGDSVSLTFTCELGPKEYAMTGPDGNELSDRWQESLIMKERVEKTWQEAVASTS